MEFKRDLLKKEKKSIFRIVLGILLLVILGMWIINRILDNQIIRPLDWLFFGIIALNGIVHIIEGSGFSIAKLFGNAFVSIDDKLISIKLGIIDKEQNIYWNSIKKIDYNLNKFKIQNIDDVIITLDLSKFDYALKNEIKESIISIAKNKNIQTDN